MRSDYKNFQLSRDDTVLTITINNPHSPLNTVDDSMHEEFAILFSELKNESDARAIVLRGSKRAFSAGGDFNWFKSLRTPKRLQELNRTAKQLIWDFLDIQVPIVVAVNGPALGLGASIALFGDLIVMGESAKIGDPHVRAGIVAGDGGVVAWPLAVGPAKAKEFLLTGDPISALEAQNLGLVNYVVSDDKVFDEASRHAQRLAAAAPLAVQFTKMSVNKLVKDALNTSFDTSTAYELTTFMSEDHVEAVDAFLHKRSPVFQGR